jgi:hypothetical protein
MTIDKLARHIVDDYYDGAPDERYQAQIDLVKRTLRARMVDDGDPMTRIVWVPVDTTVEGDPI